MEELKKLVTCPNCQQLYQRLNNRLLPCLHTFCVQCVRNFPVTVQICPNSDATTPLAQDESKSICTREITKPANAQHGAGVVKTSSKMSQSRNSSTSEGIVCQYIECPKCKKQCLLPERGADGFQCSLILSDLVSLYLSMDNYGREAGPRCLYCKDSPVAVAYCDKCRYFICNMCVKMHKRWREFESHQVTNLEDLQKESTKEEAGSSGGLDLMQKLTKTQEGSAGIPSFLKQPLKLQDISCYHHSEEKIKFYCPVCRELLCHDCYIIAHQHHPTVSITSNVLEDHKCEMSSIACGLGDISQQLDNLGKTTIEEKESLTKHVSEVRDVITNTFTTLEEKLKARQATLLEQLNKLEQEPLEKLKARENDISRLQCQVTESKAYIEDNMSHSGPTAMLSVEQTVIENNEALSSDFTVIPPLEKSPQFQFFADDQLLDIIPSLGEVGQLVSEDTVSVGDRYSDNSGQLDSFLGADQLSLSSLRSRSSFYQTSELQMISDLASSSELSSLYNHSSIITNSIAVSVPRVQGDAIRTIEGFNHPSGLTSANFLLLSEFGTEHTVSVLTHQGILIRKIGVKGDQDGEFFYPQCIAVDSMEQLFITDSNYRIQVFNSVGNWLKTIGTKGRGKLQFKDPVGVAIGTNRRIFVCERENNRIQVLDSDLSHYMFIGRRGKGPVEFNQPSDIAIDSLGLVYVVDSWNHRIQVLTQDGSFVQAIGSKGKGSGQLLSPTHICIDPDGFVYVSERRNHRISMFTMRGKFVKSFGEHGNGLGQFVYPTGIAVDLNKILYVCDYGNNRIQVFK